MGAGIDKGSGCSSAAHLSPQGPRAGRAPWLVLKASSSICPAHSHQPCAHVQSEHRLITFSDPPHISVKKTQSYRGSLPFTLEASGGELLVFRTWIPAVTELFSWFQVGELRTVGWPPHACVESVTFPWLSWSEIENRFVSGLREKEK